eukprot:UN18339
MLKKVCVNRIGVVARKTNGFIKFWNPKKKIYFDEEIIEKHIVNKNRPKSIEATNYDFCILYESGDVYSWGLNPPGKQLQIIIDGLCITNIYNR